jgi:ABC-type multidrug transport system fused ATPase/permease subunit
MHAVGHGLLALASAGLAFALSGRGALGFWRSTPLGGDGPPGELLFSLSFLGLGALVVKATTGAYAAYAQARLAGEAGTLLRLRVLDGLLTRHRLRPAGHDDHGAHASQVAALTSRVREVESGLAGGVLQSLRAGAQLVPLVALLVWLSPGLATIGLAVIALFGAGLAALRRRWKRANMRAAREGDELLGAADEAVRHAELWVSYRAEKKVRGVVKSIGARLARRTAWLDASAAGLSGANEVLGGLALVLALGASRAGWLGLDGGRLVAFAAAFFLAYRPLRDLGDARLAASRASAAYERIQPLLAVADTRDEPAEAGHVPAVLELRGLALARGSLGAIDATVAPGEIVVMVGPTGAGKTTLLRTLLGLEEPASGQVLWNGAPLEGSPGARPFAWVPQEAPVLADTIEGNVRLSEDAGDAGAALAELGAGGLDLDRDARRLSGGERQWVALARAIATRRPVLLLDEPTSGLDADAQARVLAAIARLRGKRTVILVTHRAEPLTIADHVLRVGARSAKVAA